MTVGEYLDQKGIKFISAIKYKRNDKLTQDIKEVIDNIDDLVKMTNREVSK